MLSYGLYTIFTLPLADKFILMFLVPAVLFLLKSNFFFLSFLIAFQINVAFLAVGAPDLILKTAFVFFIFFFIFYNITYSLIAAVVSLYLFFIPAYQGYSIVEAVVLFLAIAYITTKIYKREIPIFQQDKINRILIIFYLWSISSILWAQQLNYALFDAGIYTSLILIYFLSSSIIKEDKQLIWVMRSWIIVGIIYSIIKPIAPSSTVAVDAEAYGTAAAIFSAKNTISSLLNFSTIAMVAMLYYDKRFYPRLLMILGFLPILITDYFFGSKGGMISLGFGILFYIIMVNPNNKAFRKRFTTFLAVISTIALIIVIPLVPLVMLPLGESIPMDLTAMTQQFPTLGFRFDQWGYAAEMMAEHGNHLTGLGIAGYKSLYQDYYEFISERYPYWYSHPHSYWVYTYTDLGIIGMCILHLFFILWVWKMRDTIIYAKNKLIKIFAVAAFAGVIQFWIHGIVDFPYSESNRMWFFIGIGMAIYLMNKKIKTNHSTTETSNIANNERQGKY